MSKSLEHLVTEELKPGEELIWSGRCMSKRGQQRKEAGPWFGFFIGGFFGLFILGCTHYEPLVLAIPILSVVGGIVTLRMRPSKLYRKKQSIFALTDRRILIVRDLYRDRQVKTLPLQFIRDVQVSQVQADGRGTIRFRTRWETPQSFSVASYRFLMIGNVQYIHDLICWAKDRREYWMSYESTNFGSELDRDP